MKSTNVRPRRSFLRDMTVHSKQDSDGRRKTCSAVFITGLAPDFAAENVGYFTSPYAERAKVGKPVIDRINKTVHITLPNAVTRTTKYLRSQRSVTLPVGQDAESFKPITVKSRLPDASRQRC